MIGFTIHHNPLTHLSVSTLSEDGHKPVWGAPALAQTIIIIPSYNTPTPPLRNLLLEDTPHGVLNTGPLPPLGNNWIKAGITIYCNGFFGSGCVKVGNAGVGDVIWGGRGV